MSMQAFRLSLHCDDHLSSLFLCFRYPSQYVYCSEQSLPGPGQSAGDKNPDGQKQEQEQDSTQHKVRSSSLPLHVSKSVGHIKRLFHLCLNHSQSIIDESDTNFLMSNNYHHTPRNYFLHTHIYIEKRLIILCVCRFGRHTG